ncbi:MAG: DsbA family protein [Rhodospirillales bacterium]|nr:DsbA family protein [Rhodospirillales bacterium]
MQTSPQCLRAPLVGFLISLLLLPGLARAEEADFTSAEEEEIGRLIRAYILEHPEVILEAIEELRHREEQASVSARQSIIAESKAAIYEDPGSPVAGNPDGDVTIVEFFDYNCSYCKRMTPEIFGLLAQDGNIRYIAKEWPIFGEDSEFAARAALASARQGKYARFHQALMAIRGPANPETVRRAAEAVDVDWEQLQIDMGSDAVTEQLVRTHQLAVALGVQGTPAIVIGENFLPGAVPAAEISAIVAEERARIEAN